MLPSDDIDTPRGPARIDTDLPAGPAGPPDRAAAVAPARAPAPAGHLDEAWTAVLAVLRERHADVPTILVGGRSSGARVACRTARAVGAVGVVALAFPLHPPGRPERSRAAELATGLPTLVVNGDRDPFGMPASGPHVRVVSRPGETHDLRRDPAGTATVVRDWLRSHGWTAD
ncbi:alpha/beta family hydrolase [Micromonospora sp. DT4]|uniref:alpha/beta hydrolase family protein n=1 Tax=Micromonospora sp. DT4 TaxID=3393438 RepID=UPI003CF3D41E